MKLKNKSSYGWSADNASLYFENLSTERKSEAHANRLMEASSLIKIPVVEYSLRLLEARNASLDTILKIKPTNLSLGSGIINWTDWRELSIDQLIILIAMYSDCTATNCLIDFIYAKNDLNRYLKQLGLKTRLQMKNIQFSNDEMTMPNIGITTAGEIARLCERLFISSPYASEMSAHFERIATPWYGRQVTAQMLGSEKLCVKTGSMKMIGSSNDCTLNLCGVVFFEDTSYSFGYLNRFKLGPEADDQKLLEAISSISSYFVDSFKKFRSFDTNGRNNFSKRSTQIRSTNIPQP